MNENIAAAQQQNGRGSIYGQGEAAVRPAYAHETHASNWTQAKNRLDEAVRKLSEARGEEEVAREAEEAAWQDLHESSGRVPPRDKPKTMESGTLGKVPYYPPPNGGFIPTPGLR